VLLMGKLLNACLAIDLCGVSHRGGSRKRPLIPTMKQRRVPGCCLGRFPVIGMSSHLFAPCRGALRSRSISDCEVSASNSSEQIDHHRKPAQAVVRPATVPAIAVSTAIASATMLGSLCFEDGFDA